MRHPHTVRLDGPAGTLMITRRLSDLAFRSDIESGFAGGSITLKAKISLDEISQYENVLIYDGRNGNQVGGGRILTPGRSASSSGDVAKIAFIPEGRASMDAVEKPHTFIDGDDGNWDLTSRTTRRFDASAGTPPNSSSDDTALVLEVTEDKTIAVNSELVMTNKLLTLGGQLLGGLGFTHKSGVALSNWRVRGVAWNGDLSGSVTVIDDPWDTALSSRRKMTVNGDFSNRVVAGISWKRLNATYPSTEDTWSSVREPVIQALIFGQDRNPITTGYTNEYIYAHQCFTDWVAQYCPRLDIENARITPGTFQFTQLSWPGGINGSDMMKEILAIEEGLRWGVYERQRNGRWRVALEPLATAVRYEIPIDDGFDDQSPTDELCNVVYVLWTSPNGKDRTTRVPATGTATVRGIPDGEVRSRVLDLGSDVGSTTQAIARGNRELADHAYVPNGGTVTLGGSRRVWDIDQQREVAPWEIEPGALCRLRGVFPRPDTLNPAGGRNGSTVCRIVSMSWSDSSSQAVLELDSYSYTLRRKIADIVRQIRRKAR